MWFLLYKIVICCCESILYEVSEIHKIVPCFIIVCFNILKYFKNEYGEVYIFFHICFLGISLYNFRKFGQIDITNSLE